MNPPVIDRRQQSDLAAQLRDLITTHAPEWPTAQDVQNDPAAEAFVQVFARLMKILIDRLNRVPDKNFLTFLRMLGFDLTPPRAARVPLQFRPQANVTEGGKIPAGTQVAVEGTQNETIFETREDMTLTLPAITRAVSYEPSLDRFTDHASIFDDADTTAASLFEGSLQVPHRIYFGHDTLYDFSETARVQFDLAFKYPLSYAGTDWKVRWYQIDEEGQPAEIIPDTPDEATKATAALLADGTVEFPSVAPVGTAELAGFIEKSAVDREWTPFAAESRWIYAELDSSLPVDTFARAEGLEPELMLSSDQVILTSNPFLPFREVPPSAGDVFLIGSAEVFGRAGSTVVIHVDLKLPYPFFTADAVLRYSFFNGVAWEQIAVTSTGGVTVPGEYDFVDTTNAFTVPGQIRFFVPEGVVRSEGSAGNSLETHWIRVEIVSGGYGSGETLQPPLIETLTLEHTNVPELATATARVLIDSEPAGVKLDAAFLNLLEIDLSRDFFPFGERPKFNDTFYIASEEVFGKTDGSVTIKVVISPGLLPVPDASASLNLLWEYYDGSDWQFLGRTSEAGELPVVPPAVDYEFVDGTGAFTSSGDITFKLPPSAKWTIRAQERTFLRVRIVAGNYGTDPNYTPPAIESFRMVYTFESAATPKAVVLENNFFFKDESETILANAQPAATIKYIEPFAAPADRDASVLIGFDRDIASEPLSVLFPLVTRPFNAFLGAFNPNPPEIAWEYWTGTQWSGVSINDRSENLTRKEIVQILPPGNTRSRPVFGDDRFWIRMRLQRGSFSLKPEIQKVYTNVVWSDNQVTLKEEVLGSSNAQPSQEFTTARSPVLSGQRIVVLEEALTEEDRQIIQADEGEDAIDEKLDDAGDVTETRVRWHQVQHFEFSNPRSRHYTIDSGSGQIIFGDGAKGYIPPAGTNNIIAEEYRTGGGIKGNVPDGVNEPRTSFPFVEGVDNPFAAEGGVDQESLDDIRVRGPAAIKHRNRAVTHEDYDALVRESSGQIARVRTLQSTDSNFDFRPGYVTIIIVPESKDDKPFPSPELVESVEEYIHARASGYLLDASTPKINVVGPGFVNVSVEADVAYQNISEAKQVETRIREALNEFLHPLTGGPDGTGWEFGRNVFISEIYATIENVEGVDYVERATLRSTEQIYDLTAAVAFTPQVPFPVGSKLAVSGQRVTPDGPISVVMTYNLVEKLREDVSVQTITAVAFREGDFATLSTPADEERLKLLILSVNGDVLEIDATFADAAYPAGSLLTIYDSSDLIVSRTTLVEAVPAETEITGLITAVPAAGDAFALTSQTTTSNVQSGHFETVSDQVSVIELNSNFLVYPGSHLIRAAQNA